MVGENDLVSPMKCPLYSECLSFGYPEHRKESIVCKCASLSVLLQAFLAIGQCVGFSL